MLFRSLFQAHNRHFVVAGFLAGIEQVVVHLTGAHHHALDLFGVQVGGVANHRLEAAGSQVGQRRQRVLQTQGVTTSLRSPALGEQSPTVLHLRYALALTEAIDDFIASEVLTIALSPSR